MFPALLGALGRVGAGSLGAGSGSSALSSSLLDALGSSTGSSGVVPGVEKFTEALKPLGDSLGKAQDLSGRAGAGMGKVGDGLGRLAGAAGKLQEPLVKGVALLGQFRDGVTSFGDSMGQFVSLANPAVFQRFRFASEDLTASIGRALLPAMQFATKLTRMFADVVFGLSGPFQRVGKAFEPLTNLLPKFTDAISPLVRTIGNIVGIFAELVPNTGMLEVGLALLHNTLAGLEMVLNPAIALVVAFGRALGDLARSANAGLSLLARRIAPGMGRDSVRDSSVGAAVRSVQMGSVESFQQKAFAQAFALGSASTAEERAAAGIENLVKLVQGLPAKMWEYIKGLPDEAAAKLWAEISKAIPRLPDVPGLPSLPGGVTPGSAYDRIAGAAVEAGRRVEDKADAAHGAAVGAADRLGIPVPDWMRPRR